MAKSSKSGASFLATEFCYPEAKSGPSGEVSFKQKSGGYGSGDFLSGPDGAGKVQASSESNSPVKGPGYGDSKVVHPGDSPRSAVSYGSK